MKEELLEYLFSGTVGDAYIALCKLVKIARATGCSLRRLCRHSGSDHAIAQLAELFPGVSYSTNFHKFDTIPEMRDYAFSQASRYVNIYWDGRGRDNEPDDAPGVIFTPYPKLLLKKKRLTRRRRLVAIQLNSGSRAGCRRLLDIEWVLDFCRALERSEIAVLILGTAEGYSEEELLLLKSLPFGSDNMVGPSSIKSWLEFVCGVDLLIAPEGVVTFFALSQRVPTLVAFEDPSALLRMPQQWRNNAICMRPCLHARHDTSVRWIPHSATDLADIVLARLDPECLMGYSNVHH